MGITLQLYNHHDMRGETLFLDSGELVSTIDYNGVDLSLPTGELRLQNVDQKITHFAFVVGGATRICRLTGIKSVNASVITYTYEIDFLKDIVAYTGDFSMFYTTPLLKEYGRASRSDYWARWRNDPSYQSTGAIQYGVTYGNIAPGMMNALVLNSGVDDYCRPKVFLIGRGATEAIIDYLNTSQYAEAFYKQIMGLYYVPCLRGAWTDTTGMGHLQGDFTYTNTDIAFSTRDEDGNVITETVVAAQPCLTITGNVYTVINTGLYITLNDFLDIYNTHYEIYIPFVGNVEIPIKMWAKLAYAQTESLTINTYIKYNYNFYDGTFTISFDDNTGYVTNPPLTPYLFREQIEMPTVSLPTGAQAFSFYSNRVGLKGQIAGNMVQAGVSAFQGDVSGVMGAVINTGMAAYRTGLKNDLTEAAGQSYGACSGWTGTVNNQFMGVAIREVFATNYDSHAAIYGFIPLYPLVDATGVYADDLVGRRLQYDAAYMKENMSQIAYPYVDRFIDVLARTSILFNGWYVPFEEV